MATGVLINSNAKVTAADNAATNGVVHIIDTVLIPPTIAAKPTNNIVELAQGTNSLSTLVTALTAGNLVTALEGNGPFTVVHIIDTVLIPPKTISNSLPNPSTNGAVCKSWCSSNPQDWAVKCTWDKFCAGCSQCPRNCKTWCEGHSKDWQSKCTWKRLCDGCTACAGSQKHAAQVRDLPTTRTISSFRNSQSEPLAVGSTHSCSLLFNLAVAITFVWMIFV